MVNQFLLGYVFPSAFLMRPLGGVITGHTGDLNGRRGALVMSMVMMAVPTFAMGCLPSYERVGWISTLLLVFCRLLQGMSVGGQLTSSIVFTVERQAKENWGYFGALVTVSYFDTFLRHLLTSHRFVQVVL